MRRRLRPASFLQGAILGHPHAALSTPISGFPLDCVHQLALGLQLGDQGIEPIALPHIDRNAFVLQRIVPIPAMETIGQPIGPGLWPTARIHPETYAGIVG